MTADAPAAPVDEPTPEPTGDRRWRPRHVAVATIVVALVMMWGYVLYLAFGPGRQPPIDRLDDPAFASAAEPRCAAALAEIDELPVASAAPDAAARADVLDRADAVYADMLDDLETQVTLAPAGDQRRRAREWLADWRTTLADRQAFADALRTDPDARLLVSEKEDEGRHVTGWIDEFAKANQMPSCVSPTDA